MFVQPPWFPVRSTVSQRPPRNTTTLGVSSWTHCFHALGQAWQGTEPPSPGHLRLEGCVLHGPPKAPSFPTTPRSVLSLPMATPQPKTVSSTTLTWYSRSNGRRLAPSVYATESPTRSTRTPPEDVDAAAVALVAAPERELTSESAPAGTAVAATMATVAAPTATGAVNQRRAAPRSRPERMGRSIM